MPARPHVQSLFGLACLTASHPAIRRLKRQMPQHSLHGNKRWNASVLLMDYLQQHPPETGSRVLELGCGWGLNGIFCSRFQNCAVTALDADEAVFPFLQLQADHNKTVVEPLHQDLGTLTASQLSQFDVIIGSDICFWDDMAETVFATIDRALDAGVKRIVISDPNRPPFIELAEACVEAHFAEVLPWHCHLQRNYKGSILLIENA